ncbi:transcription termination/antitermination protein NusG [Hallella multisaccharivorax DSM 17128]|mgnify:CR=1 FL=1|uniref:Transcription termination/antitermination protein NusG n=1 Tax=Hallella multisaccharivorax DSM 17128 TaxID=688246 RepID=F8NA51_9BACT|nr:transcription termination/antitermination protein NusG [Hallella multisaccharivorax]EGN55781.1 transcription antitermination protein nusG [Hallella multisaccharivorax DSM 17128]GJG29281.1 transcription termination/antitermination protein NusG [Hallella multisaccharivorax DSM 17128]
MADSNKKWYVMSAISGKEAKLKEYIENEMRHNHVISDHVSQVMIPMEKHAVSRNGKIVEKERISLPGYVFVEAEMTPDLASTLRFMPNCLGFLGGLSHPSPVPLSQINRMLGAAEESSKEMTSDVPYILDETIKVIDGPFSGFEGVIEDINTEKHTLKVMVKIFGRNTPLELSYAQVEKIAE